MKDFISAALPWIIVGITLAILFVSLNANKKKSKDSDEYVENYGTLGMLIGMSIGSAIGHFFKDTSIGMSTGMLFGLSIGMCVKKQKEEYYENSNN